MLFLFLLFLSIVSSSRIRLPSSDSLLNLVKTDGKFKTYNIEFERITKNNDTVMTNMFITMDPRYALNEYEGVNIEVKRQKRSASIPTCCAFIGGGAKWNGVATFKFDITNPDGLSSSQLETWQNAAFNQWNNALTDLNVLAPVVIEDLPGFLDPNVPDGINTIVFDIIDITGVIAITSTNYIQSGGSVTIFESDIVYNTQVPLGDGSSSSNVYDFWSVATHETGHAIGLAHPPQTNECVDSTMYPTVGLGQTNKRDITGTDAQCLQILYSDSSVSNASWKLINFSLFTIVSILFSL